MRSIVSALCMVGQILLLACVLAISGGSQTKDDLGQQIQSISNPGRVVFSSGGDTHYVGFYDTTTGTTPIQIFHVNITTGASYVVSTGVYGRSGAISGVVASLTTGHFWFVTYGDCKLVEYDLAGGVALYRGDDWMANRCTSIGGDGPREVREGPDGKLWFTMATEGQTMLTQVDPVTHVIVEYGVPNPPAGNPTCTGCYRILSSMWVDENYVYIGVRDMLTNAYYPVIFKQSDKAQTVCESVGGVGGGGVYKKISDGSLYWLKYISPTYTWYTMPTDGTCPSETVSAQTGTYYTYRYNGSIYYQSNDAGYEDDYFNIDLDVSSVDANAATSGVTIVGYRSPAGSGSYTYKQGVLSMPYNAISRVISKASTSSGLFLVSGQYLPNAEYDTASSTISIKGADPSQSSYAVNWDGTYWYTAGYDSSINRYDPAAAWTVNGGTSIGTCAAGTTNPCRVGSIGATRHYWSALGSDGRVYFAGDWERDRTGGSIVWYNPADNSTGEYRLPELACFTSNELIAVAGGDTLLYSGVPRSGVYGCSEATSKIFVFDVATRAITTSYTVTGITSSHGQLITLDSGHVMGLIYTDSSHYTVYSFDPATGDRDWTANKSGDLFHAAAKYDRKASLGADGAVYCYVGHNLSRISPVDGTVETVYADSTGYGGMALAGMPSGQGFYLWGSTHLYRINLWRPAALRVKNSQSTATQIRLLYGRTTTLDATSQTVACAYNADCYVSIPGHVIGDMYYRWQFLTAGGTVTAASDITKVTIN